MPGPQVTTQQFIPHVMAEEVEADAAVMQSVENFVENPQRAMPGRTILFASSFSTEHARPSRCLSDTLSHGIAEMCSGGLSMLRSRSETQSTTETWRIRHRSFRRVSNIGKSEMYMAHYLCILRTSSTRRALFLLFAFSVSDETAPDKT